jgi:two-component system nitrate/nitrite response regulator NarL
MQLARPIASVIDFAAAKRRMRKKSHGSHRVSPVRDCVRVVIAIRSQVFLQSLRHLLNAKDDFVIVAACHDTSACLAAICEHKPDLAVFETLLPGGGAVRILAAIAAERLHVRPVLLISSTKEVDESERALALGACSIILRQIGPESLVRRLRQVAAGQRVLLPRADRISSVHDRMRREQHDPEKMLVALTPREQQIIGLAAREHSNRQIASLLGIRESTVKVHLNHIFQKLGIHRREKLANLWSSLPPRPGVV